MKTSGTQTCATAMRGYADNWVESLRRNRKVIFLCLIATFVWGLIAHSYIFLHSSFSHDSLNEFNSDVFGNDWKIQLGRVFVPAYRFVARSSVTLPWMIGVLSLLYIALAVFLTVKIFDINSNLLIVLVSGIFTVNIAVIATAATYMHDLDCNMMSLALAVLSVYLWKRYDKGFVYGMIPLCISIGLYQSYISVAITLIIIYLVLQLLDGEEFARAFKQGIKGIGMIIGAAVLFFVAMKVICYATGNSVKTGDYNSIDTVFSMSVPQLIKTTISGYKSTIYRILKVKSVYPHVVVLAAHIIMIVSSGAIVLFRVFRKEIKVKETLLTLALLALIPFSMNVVYPLTGGMSHALMEFGFWLIYLFVLLVSWRTFANFKKMKPLLKYGQRFMVAFLIFAILWGNVQLANTAYLKKNLEQKANLSLFTRIVNRMEQHDGYIAGETPVVFVGMPDELLDTAPGFEQVSGIVGCEEPFVLTSNSRTRFRAYFDYILLNPAIMAETEIWSQMQEDDRVADMPCYPEEGSIVILDGILVVKLGG